MRSVFAIAAIIIVASFSLNADAARSKKLATSGVKPTNDAAAGMLEYKAAEIAAYNQGVDALEKNDHAAARKHFEAALALNEKFPEAHNNLAYTLRMQSLENADASLEHYNRALELAPKFARAHYYRGVLFVQLDRDDDAEKARVALVALNTDEAKEFAAELAKVIKAGKAKKSENTLSIYGNIVQ